MKRVTLVSALVVFVTIVAATLAVAGEPIVIGETVTIPSQVMGEDRTILVSTPTNYDRSQERYPVLYMTDGNQHLTHTRGTVDFLVRNGLMPDVIIVGVNNTDRTRDLTPTHAFRTLDDGSKVEIANSGGAGRFLDFFEKELIPYVEGHYRTAPYRIFTGHSYGGLFSLYALASRSELFDSYIAASPSLNYDEDLPLRLVEKLVTEREKLPKTLYVTMANEEEDTPAPTRLDRLQTILGGSKAKGFMWRASHMPEETHGTVVLRTHYWGLRTIFDGWRLPPTEGERNFNGTVADIKTHFRGVSERLGFEVVPSENTVNQAGYQVLGREDYERAIAIFRYNVELYPDSANVYDSLGEAYENAGRIDEAHSSYARAVENAKKLKDDRVELFTQNRDRAAAAIKERKDSK